MPGEAAAPIPAPADPPATAALPERGWLARWAGPGATLAMLALAGWALHRELAGLHYRALVEQLRLLSRGQVLRGIGLALLAYAVLPGYDLIALRATGRHLGTLRVAFSSFIAYALSQTLGFPLLTGGSVRFRFWSAWGLDSSEIASAMSHVATTFLLGLVAVTSVVFVVEPASTAMLLGLPISSLRPVGWLGLALVLAYLIRCARQRGPVAWRGIRLPVPSFPLALLQLGVAALDWSLAAAVLWVLLPAGTAVSFATLLGAFMIAQVAGLVSHVPGGLGVFEGVMVVLLGGRLEPGALVGTLVAFRAVYYLLPFVLGTAMLGGWEVVRQESGLLAATRWGRTVARVSARWIPGLLPFVLGAAAFIAGLILVASGATPAVHGRLRILNDLLPLGVIEVSHFVGSLVGGALMVLGWALSRRLDAAYRLTQALLGIGILASLLKGLDYEEAIALSVVFLLLLPARRSFYRRSALTAEPVSPGWIVALVVALGFTTWLGFFSYKHVAYSSELWWQFSLHGDAPRYLRALVGVMVPITTLAFLRLVRRAGVAPALPGVAELRQAATIANASAASGAQLALLGDKRLLFNAAGTGFVMYGVAGRSWVAMGDPVGEGAERRELAWAFRQLADQHGGWTVFYEVTQEALPLYIDLGLTLLKLGEEAIVPLPEFSLEGGSRRRLRRAHREGIAAGASFSVEPAERVPELLPELREVSASWLAEKHTREKGFSLGRFDPDYLRWFPVAVCRVEGKVVAFTNLWCAREGTEISVDLMRYSAVAPEGVMTYLFIEMMLWGKARGYRSFNLGMAPLAGLENRAHAPLWARTGAFMYEHGDSLYHFAGLRLYKEKFDPEWRPRYLASPAGFALPVILANIAALVSGSLTGVVRK